MSTKLALVVFDWDGTLMDSEHNIVRAMRAAFNELSLAPPPAAAIRQVIGLALDQAIGRLLIFEQQQQLAALEAAYRAQYQRQSGPSPLFDSTREVLAELRGRGYVLAVATGKSRAGLNRAIVESGLEGMFSATRSADQCASKPAPDMLEELLEETGFEPSRAIMVGDTTYDLEMAKHAGTFAAAAGYGAHAVQELKRFAPSFVLDAISELPDKLRDFESQAG